MGEIALKGVSVSPARYFYFTFPCLEEIHVKVKNSNSGTYLSQDIDLVGPTRQVPFDRVLRTPL